MLKHTLHTFCKTCIDQVCCLYDKSSSKFPHLAGCNQYSNTLCANMQFSARGHSPVCKQGKFMLSWSVDEDGTAIPIAVHHIFCLCQASKLCGRKSFHSRRSHQATTLRASFPLNPRPAMRFTPPNSTLIQFLNSYDHTFFMSGQAIAVYWYFCKQRLAAFSPG